MDDKKIKVKINQTNYKRFEKKGYNIAKTDNGEVTQQIIEVNENDLSKGSHAIVVIECEFCGETIEREYRNAIKGSNFCNSTCKGRWMTKSNIEKLELKLNKSLKDYLIDEYINKRRTTRQIAKELYGNEKCHSSINNWMRYFEIPMRHGSEAIETQWIDNPERRAKTGERLRKSLGLKHVPKCDKSIRDLRKTSEYSEWRLSVFYRDRFTCVKCKAKRDKDTNIVAHHKNSFTEYEELRYDVDNGATLCEGCHVEFHSKYGNVKNTEEQFKEFLEEAR